MESLEVAWPHVFWFKVLVLRRMLVYHTFCKIIPERILPKDVTMSSFRIYFSIFPYVFLLDVHAFGFCFFHILQEVSRKHAPLWKSKIVLLSRFPHFSKMRHFLFAKYGYIQHC